MRRKTTYNLLQIVIITVLFLPVFSAAYALSAYTLAFINQFMWMDAVICLPLVIKGIDNIRSKRGGILYIAALSYTIISNFYIGYMVCLFSVVYFAGCVIGDRMSLGQLWEKIWRFLLYSLIAGAVSVVYTLPAYYAIRNTAASGADFGEGGTEVAGVREAGVGGVGVQ